MENPYEENLVQPSAALIINPQIENFLFEIIKWGRFLSILGFVASGIIAIIGVVLIIFSPFSSESILIQKTMASVMGAFYILIGMVYFFPSRFLYNFCGNTRLALTGHDQDALDFGFQNLKSTFKFWGIVALIMIVFYGLALIGIFAAQFLFRS